MPTTLRSDPNDPALSVVDTTPAGADPDVLASFDTSTDDESLDPNAYGDEPWTDVDPEATDDGATSFDPTVALADTSTYERWLQSALRALVAPDLAVDGKPGARTKAALERFQKQSHRLGAATLRADGVAGPRSPPSSSSPAPPPRPGMGRYHGKATFDLFSNHKPIGHRSTLIEPGIQYPPYTSFKEKVLRWVLR